MSVGGQRIEVVRAGVDDVGRIAPLFDAYRLFYGLLSNLAGGTEYLTERLSRVESVVLLAVDAAAPESAALGFTQLYPSFSSLAMRPVWILNDLFVAPAARRLGVGRALLEHARRVAAEAGAIQMTLQTAVTNHAAQALYESLGWRRDTLYYTYELDV